MKVSFPFEIRQAMQVAMAVARSRGDRNPCLLGIRGVVPTFHFEGGLVVKVNLLDVGGFNGQRRRYQEEYMVSSVEVRYWGAGDTEGVKKVEVWGPERLRELRASKFGWWHPNVGDPAEIEAGFVGVFYDGPRGEGYTVVDPGGSQSLRNMVTSFPYTFAEGDLERALAEAREKLEQIRDRASESVRGTVFER